MVNYPVVFYVLEDGTWLVKDIAVSGWFHITNLIPFIKGYENTAFLTPTQISELKKRAIAKCDIGFEYLKEIKNL